VEETALADAGGTQKGDTGAGLDQAQGMSQIGLAPNQRPLHDETLRETAWSRP
jgi:hypothetical protein